MNYIKWPLNSYGTFYGTLREYDGDGQDVGPKNINGYGIFFAVRNKWSYQQDSTIIFRKSIGTGISIADSSAGSNGRFIVTIQATNVDKNPNEYVYESFISESGSVYVEGTTQLKSIGSGIFEITKGVKYGTA